MMFTLKVAALAATCGFGAYFGWNGAKYLVAGIAAFFSGLDQGYQTSRGNYVPETAPAPQAPPPNPRKK